MAYHYWQNFSNLARRENNRDTLNWLESNMSHGIDTNLHLDFKQLHMDIVAEFLEGLLTYRTPFTIVLMILYSVTFTVGLVSNSLAILAVLKHKHMRTITNMFLVNLSVGNLLVVIVCMPLSLASYVYKVGIMFCGKSYVCLHSMSSRKVICFYALFQWKIE